MGPQEGGAALERPQVCHKGEEVVKLWISGFKLKYTIYPTGLTVDR